MKNLIQKIFPSEGLGNVPAEARMRIIAAVFCVSFICIASTVLAIQDKDATLLLGVPASITVLIALYIHYVYPFLVGNYVRLNGEIIKEPDMDDKNFSHKNVRIIFFRSGNGTIYRFTPKNGRKRFYVGSMIYVYVKKDTLFHIYQEGAFCTLPDYLLYYLPRNSLNPI